MTLIVHTEPAQWVDPWGIKHDAYDVLDIRDVEHTGEIVQRPNGYGGVLNDRAFEDREDGTRFLLRDTIDYWGSNCYSELGRDERENGRVWRQPVRNHRYLVEGQPWIPAEYR